MNQDYPMNLLITSYGYGYCINIVMQIFKTKLTKYIFLSNQVAENLADELARSDGREIRLEEEDELTITFVQPEEGFSYEVARGVPPGLIEFIQPLQQAGMCRLTLHSNASGLWTVYFLPNVIFQHIFVHRIRD